MCPICGSSNVILVKSGLRFGKEGEIYKCSMCGIVYLDPSSYKKAENFYEEEYHGGYFSKIDKDVVDCEKYFKKMIEPTKIWSSRIFLDVLDDFLDVLDDNADMNILDIGCSVGNLIENLKIGNFIGCDNKIYGTEINKREVEFCKSKGFDVSDEPLEDRFNEKYFDVITMLFVLEHIERPVEFLRHVKKFLKDNGKLVIVVPNLDDPLLTIYDNEEFFKFYFCKEHLYYYTCQTIKYVLSKAGFNCVVKAAQEYPLKNHLDWHYRGKAGEIDASRDIDLMGCKELHHFWEEVDSKYRNILWNKGLTDRLFIVAEKE